MKRIAIIGCGGAGKSTLTRKLGEILNIPVFHLDTLYWKPGWVETPEEEWREVVKGIISKDIWITDGNYSKTLDNRLDKADTIIYLDMPFYLCFYRIIKRRIMYHGKTRPDMNRDCPEKIDLEFIRWVWNYNRKQRPQLIKRLSKLSNTKKVIICKNSEQVKKLIEDIQNSKFDRL